MQLESFLILGSIEAVRPVFWIVMGVSLMMIAWRLTRKTPGWTGRVTLAGALLLGLGYSIILPLPASGLLPSARESATAVEIWQASRLVALNGGWLLFGLGLAMHARLFHTAPARQSSTAPNPSPAHESAA